MKTICLLTVWVLLSFVAANAQSELNKRKSALSFNISLSDYQLPATIEASSISDAFKGKEWYSPGNKSVGFGLTYWKELAKIIDFSGTLTGSFSNFPPNYVKDDAIGEARFSPQADVLLHLKMFSDRVAVNPFLSAGAGAGYFPKQLVAYAPLGLGFRFNFSKNTFGVLQLQYRKKLTDGISNDYTFYSFSIAHALFKKSKAATPKAPIVPDEPIKPAAVTKIADADFDNVPDSLDECPNQYGTLNGCPDSDKDGIADKDDQCKEVPGIAKYKGCPVPDSDGDGVNDEADKCPDEIGTAANSGCPVITKEVSERVNFAAKNILFDFASDYIKPSSHKYLNEVLAILKQNPELKLSITAHSDNNGTSERNQLWSDRRARSVANYFVNKGVNRNRITNKGYGDTQPIATNNTEEGRAKNRRVEMKLSY
ncbi:MAG: OmpA family protein [Niabella sp.]